ncbi:MAG: hypothetical protein OES46_00540 [Gammaproteobacteria bacterium]|nr:hypothetical protein [Gammaproteobacteria bacterium]
MANNLALLIPEKEVSAWVAETNPKEARAWLESLPLADSGDAARDIYQALYTLNRLALATQSRLDLMELYKGPVAMVSSVLQSQFVGLALPLSPEVRKLAEFIRQLHMEMAIGYKCVIHDFHATRRPWGKKNLLVTTTERALRYLGEVLARSYQVYMPPPPEVWKEIHALYRYAEQHGRLTHPIEISEENKSTVTILERYLQIVLLAVCNPYQLPQNECNYVRSFLESRTDKATIKDQANVADPVGRFLIDLSADAPPVPFAQQDRRQGSDHYRVLSTIELARTVHGYMKRLEQGESGSFLNLGTEMSSIACRDVLKRMLKFWGLTPKRVYSRTKTRGLLALCTGVNALHFFSGGRKPFNSPEAEIPEAPEEPQRASRKVPPKFRNDESGQVEAAADAETSKAPAPPSWLSEAKLTVPDVFPVDRWQLRDESARGLLLAREGEVGAHVRVGDLLGIQASSDGDTWRAGVVRWIKSPDSNRVEMGVERLAPNVTPVAAKPAANNMPSTGRRYTQALLLPAMPVLQRPATLVLTRGIYEPGRSLHLVVDDEKPRIVRPLKLLERTASFDQIVFTEVDSS